MLIWPHEGYLILGIFEGIMWDTNYILWGKKTKCGAPKPMFTFLCSCVCFLGGQNLVENMGRCPEVFSSLVDFPTSNALSLVAFWDQVKNDTRICRNPSGSYIDLIFNIYTQPFYKNIVKATNGKTNNKHASNNNLQCYSKMDAQTRGEDYFDV